MGNEAMFVLDIKNDSLEKVQALKEEIKQNELLIRCCDDIASKGIVDPLVVKKLKYDAMNAKNAAENPDVASPEDKERAEKGVEEGAVQLKRTQQALDTILANLDYVNSESVIDAKNDLVKYVNESLDKCLNYIDYSQDIMNGNYHDLVEKEEVVEEPKKEETTEEIKDDIEEPVVEEEKEEEVIEPVEEIKVVAEEPVEEKIDTVEAFNPDNFDELTKQLDEELEGALKPVEDDIQTLHNDLDATAPIAINDPVLTDINTVTEPSELVVEPLLNNNEDIIPVVENEETTPVVNNDEIISANNVDEGPVKVVKVEEVGAPEQTDDLDRGFGRSLAA